MEYFKAKKHPLPTPVKVEYLQDEKPKDFRTIGLRTLAKRIWKIVRENSPTYCAINATGGYKAQIAIALLLGQTLKVPVYYQHERFPEIISFPPMPVSWDLNLWMKASEMLTNLDNTSDIIPYDTYKDE